MEAGISPNELALLKKYQILNAKGKRNAHDYLNYLIYQQYKKESFVQVFHNQIICNLFHHIKYLVTKENYDINHIERLVKQIKKVFFASLEQVNFKYDDIIDEMDSNEIVTGFARIYFENIETAFYSQDKNKIRKEILVGYEEFMQLRQRKKIEKTLAI